MVVRTQISLDSEAHRRARGRAHELGISLAEYVRRLVDADLSGSGPAAAEVEAVFDLGAGGRTDVARGKDGMIGDAFAAAHPSAG